MKLGKPDTPSSKHDCQSECVGIYFKSIYLVNGMRFREPGIRFCFAFVTPFSKYVRVKLCWRGYCAFKMGNYYLNDVKRGCLLTRLGGE